MGEPEKKKYKTIKTIKVDVDKCIGCRACEVFCAAAHASPKGAISNPARSRIQVVYDQGNDIYLPVYAGEYTAAQCLGRTSYLIGGREYGGCDFCRASCPSRDLFKEPDSGLPLKCDMCESVGLAPGEEPMCVQVCSVDALVYEEREEEAVEETPLGEVERGLKALVDKYGLEKVANNVSRMLQKG
ncbi:MAG: (4Fe-4S)-binding protein [Dethiobacteria bacterium]|jgi:benzoyl-CoA reductase subunit BamC